MNVTEAVDSLVCHVSTPQCTTHTASLTFFFFSAHLHIMLKEFNFSWNHPKSFNLGGKKKNLYKCYFLNQTHKLKNPSKQISVKCLLWFIFLFFVFFFFFFFFSFLTRISNFLATPYFHHHLTKHVATCPRSTLATHSRHIHSHFRICWFWQQCH